MSNNGLVFISYQREDQVFADVLRAQLQTWGWRTWMDIYDIPSGAHRPKEIETGLKAADKVIAIMTPKAVASASVVNEWEYAIVHKKWLVPLILEMCERPFTLIQHPYIDFVGQRGESWSNLEAALNDETFISSSMIDPYLPYLQKLYKRLNINLAQKVINRKDGNEQLPNPLTLKSSSTPEDVDALFAKHDDIEPLFEADSMTPDTPKRDYDDFESAFRQYEGQVLLLGEPGSGKTISLLQFARDAVVRRIQDRTLRLPMFAILPDWLQKGTPEIHEWMAQTDDAPEDAAELVRAGQTLLLFDGLDELGERAEEIDPNNIYALLEFDPRVRFMYMLRKVVRNPNKTETSGADNQLVVTCRLEDYRRTGTKIGLKGAIILKKLDQKQIAKYLEDVPGLQSIFKSDKGMLKIAESPLLLSLIAYAFRDRPKELEGLRNLSSGALRDAIFNAYIQQRYNHEQDKLKAQRQNLPFELQTLVHDLGWIAMMNATKESKSSENVLSEPDFWRVVGSSKSQSFISFCQQLNLITEINTITWRFVHLKLRDTLTYGRAEKLLKNPPISTHLFGLAGQAIVNIKDKRLISDVLTNEEDQRRLLALIREKKFQSEPFQNLEEALEGEDYYWRRYRKNYKTEKDRIDDQAMEKLLKNLDSPDHDVRYNTAETLGKLGDPRAVDRLIELLHDDEQTVCYRAVVALKVIGDARAVNALIEVMRNGGLGLRREAVEALKRIGGAHAISGLLAALDNSDVVTRSKAAEALGVIGGVYALDRLLAALSDSDPIVREKVTEALGKIDNAKARQGLITGMGDNNSGVRYAAAVALAETSDTSDTSATNSLLKALVDKDRRIRDKVAIALENIGDAGVVQGLNTLITHQDYEVRAKAAETLGRIGNVRITETFLSLLNDPNKQVRAAAAEALGRIGDGGATHKLLGIMNDPNKQVRATTAEALGRIGDAQAVNNLLSIMNDPNKQVRAAAAEALGKIGDGRAIKSLLKAISDPADPVRDNAAKALGKINDKRVLKSFVSALNDPNLHVRMIAVSVLERIAKPWTTEGLVMALNDVDENIRYEAASALGTPRNFSATEGLIKTSDDKDVNVRRISVKALGRIGSPLAIEKLLSALKDPESEVGSASAEALGRIGDADCLSQLELALNDARIAKAVYYSLYNFGNEYAFQMADTWAANNKKK